MWIVLSLLFGIPVGWMISFIHTSMSGRISNYLLAENGHPHWLKISILTFSIMILEAVASPFLLYAFLRDFLLQYLLFALATTTVLYVIKARRNKIDFSRKVSEERWFFLFSAIMIFFFLPVLFMTVFFFLLSHNDLQDFFCLFSIALLACLPSFKGPDFINYALRVIGLFLCSLLLPVSLDEQIVLAIGLFGFFLVNKFVIDIISIDTPDKGEESQSKSSDPS